MVSEKLDELIKLYVRMQKEKEKHLRELLLAKIIIDELVKKNKELKSESDKCALLIKEVTCKLKWIKGNKEKLDKLTIATMTDEMKGFLLHTDFKTYKL